MLTYSEALTLLKAGEDMRCTHWPAGHFVRLTLNKTAPGYHSQPFLTTTQQQLNTEQLQSNWVKS